MTLDVDIRTRHLGLADYDKTWQAMREFTDSRDEHTADEVWVCEHPPVYTLGQAGRHEHILAANDIPVIQSDRGGQVTYHGPGQVVVYCLINLRRAGYGIRDMVERLENSTIELLAEFGVQASGRRDAPGVYVEGAKIAALGLRVRRGCSYHGIALNLEPDLSPFLGIDPCGYRDLQVTSLKKLGIVFDKALLVNRFSQHICRQLS
ncbi:MAG: lipoyl(octanoyl) transferase LipB [Granulosicoccus sp.]|nr:lipoyl(octanoyl) transferase LipB [Granulosicoccus sp.]